MRYLDDYISRDLARKMVFVGGPRQVGKTTLAKAQLARLVAQGKAGRYFNYDFDEDRTALLAKKWAISDELLVFDELHKYADWKSWVKGLYDVRGVGSGNQSPSNQSSSNKKEGHQILVTGSARLDVYREGGDSMLGRYHHWRLHPFTLDELPSGMTLQNAFERLMRVGGFPEPFLQDDEREARRWRNARFDRILQEDIRDLEQIKNIQKLRLFLDLLRQRVGGMVVLANLAQDVLISPPTARAWLDALERMYLCFAVTPYTAASARAVQKPPKVYFFDNADVMDTATRPGELSGPRFENLVATHLLKRLHFLEDEHGHRAQLHYIRDKEGREVDFAIVIDGQLQELIEVKTSDESISPSLRYYAQRLKPPKITQIVAKLAKPYDQLTDFGQIHFTGPLDYFGRNAHWLSSVMGEEIAPKGT